MNFMYKITSINLHPLTASFDQLKISKNAHKYTLPNDFKNCQIRIYPSLLLYNRYMTIFGMTSKNSCVFGADM